MQDEPAPSKPVPHPKSPETAPAPTEVCLTPTLTSQSLLSATHSASICESLRPSTRAPICCAVTKCKKHKGYSW